MLVRFFRWWCARMAELTSRGWTGPAGCERGSIVVEIDQDDKLVVSVCQRNGRQTSITLANAVRMARRKPVLLRPPASSVLRRQHIVPTVGRQTSRLLRHELARITPFRADELIWRWDAQAKPVERVKTAVMLTMVPKIALTSAFARLAEAGMRVDALLAQSADWSRLLPVGDGQDQAEGVALARGLAWACISLFIVALVLPFGQQALALYRTENAIAELQPAVAEAEAFERQSALRETDRDLLKQEAARGGDVLQILAMLTRVVPDDTFLTGISLRERQIIFSGRSTSAARLVISLSAEPEIRAVAFAAPVMRVEGAARDIFSIQMVLEKP